MGILGWLFAAWLLMAAMLCATIIYRHEGYDRLMQHAQELDFDDCNEHEDGCE